MLLLETKIVVETIVEATIVGIVATTTNIITIKGENMVKYTKKIVISKQSKNGPFFDTSKRK
jgi:hypothetical protein